MQLGILVDVWTDTLAKLDPLLVSEVFFKIKFICFCGYFDPSKIFFDNRNK